MMASQSSFFAKTDNINTIVAMLSSIHLRRDIVRPLQCAPPR